MPSSHLVLCPLFLLPSVFPTIRVFFNESVLHIRWPKYWSFSFIIGPSNEYSGLISFRIDWLDIAVQRTLRSLPQHLNLKGQFFSTLSSLWSNSHMHKWLLEKITTALIRQTFVGREEGNDRGWDGCMVSLTQWTWVWAISKGWWWTRKPGFL